MESSQQQDENKKNIYSNADAQDDKYNKTEGNKIKPIVYRCFLCDSTVLVRCISVSNNDNTYAMK